MSRIKDLIKSFTNRKNKVKVLKIDLKDNDLDMLDHMCGFGDTGFYLSPHKVTKRPVAIAIDFSINHRTLFYGLDH